MLRKSTKLLCVLAALFILIGCEFKFDEITPGKPPAGIVIMADAVPLTGNFLFFNRQINDTRTFSVSFSEGEDGSSISWEIQIGDDKAQLQGDQGKSVVIKALGDGDVKVKITAENQFGKSEKYFDLLIGTTGSREWTFKIFDNGSEGLTEINEGEEHVVVFTEPRILELQTVGTPGGTVNFNVESANVNIASVFKVKDSFLIYGNIKGTSLITVTATVGTQPPVAKSFTVKPRSTLTIMPPVYWNSETDPVSTISSGMTGTALPIGNTGYFFRSARGTIPAVDGAFRIGGSDSPSLIIGGGNSMVSPNPAGTATNSATHVPGQLNISHDAVYRITVYYKDADDAGGASTLLRVSVNNSTNTQANSRLGDMSNLRSYTSLLALNAAGGTTNINTAGSIPGKLVISINPTLLWASLNSAQKATLETSFVALCTFGPCYLTITGISIEELDD